jgi:hypothetical protein
VNGFKQTNQNLPSEEFLRPFLPLNFLSAKIPPLHPPRQLVAMALVGVAQPRWRRLSFVIG